MAFKTGKLLLLPIRYNLHVKSVSYKKAMTNGDVMNHIFNIELTDMAGNIYYAEFFHTDKEQDIFVPGSPVIFDVVKEDTVRSIITPVFGVTQQEEYALRKDFVKPCAQESYTFAASYARDIVVKNAEIKGKEITLDDIEFMLRVTDKINNHFEKIQQQRILGL